MGTIHELLVEKGRQHTLQFDFDRRVVDVAANFMADEESGTAFLFSGWAQAALPHKRLPDDAPWQLRTERVTLLVEPGRRTMPSGPPISVGVPYGSRARLIMLYLQSEALKTNNRSVELGKSLRDWLGKMGIPPGGKSIQSIREQAERITRCRISFHLHAAGKEGLIQQHIVDTAMFGETPTYQGEDFGGNESEDSGGTTRGGSGFLETVRLSETFFEQLKRHPVPVDDAAIRAINRHSMALDIYCWLAYRLHVLSGDREITWKALHAQFGGGVSRIDHFRPVFIEHLNLALAVYPDAKVEIGGRGLTLQPSRPPISPRVKAAAISR
jgi:Plasmid encoded RepA protein